MCAQKHKLLAGSSASSSSSSSLSSSSSSGLTPAKEEITVTWQDQQSINLFSRLNTRLASITDSLSSLSSAHANTVDALDTIESLLDDDSVMVRVGEVYVKLSNDEAEQWVKQEKQSEQQQKAKLEAEKAQIESQMATLKQQLYAKFGKAINLENAEQTIND